MDPTTVPVFDFHTPWVALIQLTLLYVLPRLVGLVTDKFTKPSIKIALLAVLSVVGSSLTWLLDFLVSAAPWNSFDWTELLNVIVNSALTFALANGIFKGVIVPLGQAEKDAQNDTIKLFAADPALVPKATTSPKKGSK